MNIDKNFEVKYVGSLRTEAVHIASATLLNTDAPIDNNGKGEKFSPTDLITTSLTSCMLTIIGIHFQKLNKDLTEIHCDVQKIMAAHPRRIDQILIAFDFGLNSFSSKEYKTIERLALNCPVSNSLSSKIKIQTNLPSFF